MKKIFITLAVITGLMVVNTVTKAQTATTVKIELTEADLAKFTKHIQNANQIILNSDIPSKKAQEAIAEINLAIETLVAKIAKAPVVEQKPKPNAKDNSVEPPKSKP